MFFKVFNLLYLSVFLFTVVPNAGAEETTDAPFGKPGKFYVLNHEGALSPFWGTNDMTGRCRFVKKDGKSVWLEIEIKKNDDKVWEEHGATFDFSLAEQLQPYYSGFAKIVPYKMGIDESLKRVLCDEHSTPVGDASVTLYLQEKLIQLQYRYACKGSPSRPESEDENPGTPEQLGKDGQYTHSVVCMYE